MPARTDRATRAEKIILMVILLDSSLLQQASIARTPDMALSAPPKSPIHAPVTNSESNARGRDFGPEQITEKVMTLQSHEDVQGKPRPDSGNSLRVCGKRVRRASNWLWHLIPGRLTALAMTPQIGRLSRSQQTA